MHKVSVVIELCSVCSAPDVKECKSAAGSGVLQISSFTAVVFHIHVHGAKFSEAGADPRSLYWCEYTFVYLLGKRLFELNSSVLVSVYLSMLSLQCWKLPCSSFKCNLFQTGALELLSLNFSLQLNRTPTVLSPLGTVEIRIITIVIKNKRCVIVRKYGAALLQFTVGPLLATLETPQEGKL